MEKLSFEELEKRKNENMTAPPDEKISAKKTRPRKTIEEQIAYHETMLAKKKATLSEKKRRERTKRLIEVGAILEASIGELAGKRKNLLSKELNAKQFTDPETGAPMSIADVLKACLDEAERKED